MTEAKDFLLPDLGEGLEDATITGWSVAVGDDVELNQPLCTVETNKAEVEIPSPYAGRVLELGGAEGATVDVGALLVRIDTVPGAQQDSPSPEPTDKPARRPVLVGYGADDDIDSSRRARHGRPRAAPPVRKLAAELAVDLTALRRGPEADTVITREDVLAAAGSTGTDVQQVRGVRARMAKQMMLSRSQIPDAHASGQVDCTQLLRLRERFAESVGEHGPNVTPFVLTLRLLVLALTHHPAMNSTAPRSTCIAG
jgi:2-oxoisovalerate dehydrogenase E2 component (dihydrolipoyl transacylase)